MTGPRRTWDEECARADIGDDCRCLECTERRIDEAEARCLAQEERGL